MKTSKRLLAIIIATAMLITLVPASAFAGFFKPTMNYLALGASNTNGFGLPGFMDWVEEKEIPDSVKSGDKYFDQLNYYCYPDEYRSAGNSASGFDNTGAKSYPVLLAESLGASYNVNLMQYAQCGMRFEDLRFLLDKKYPGDSYTAWRFYENQEDLHTRNIAYIPTTKDSPEDIYVGWFVDVEQKLTYPDNPNQKELPVTSVDLPKLREAYSKAIKKADLITIDLGINSFGPYLESALFDNQLKPSEDIKLITPALLTKAKAEIIKLITDNVDGIDKEDITDVLKYVDALVYAYASYQINLVKCLDTIRRLNRNAEIVIVGMDNLLDGLNISISGIKIPAGAIFGAVIVSANAFAATYANTHCKCEFVPVTLAGGAESLRTKFLNEYALNSNLQGFLRPNSELFEMASEWFNIYDDEIMIGRRSLYEIARDSKSLEGKEIPWVGYSKNEINNYFNTAESKASALKTIHEKNTVVVQVLARMLYDSLKTNTFDIMTIIDYNGAFSNVFPGDYVKMDGNGKDYVHPRDMVDGIVTEALAGKSALEIYSEKDNLFKNSVAYQANSGDTYFGLTVPEDELLEKEEKDAIIKPAAQKTEYAFFFNLAMGNCIMLHPSEKGHRQYRDLILRTMSVTSSKAYLKQAAETGLKLIPVQDFNNVVLEPFMDYLKEQIKKPK